MKYVDVLGSNRIPCLSTKASAKQVIWNMIAMSRTIHQSPCVSRSTLPCVCLQTFSRKTRQFHCLKYRDCHTYMSQFDHPFNPLRVLLSIVLFTNKLKRRANSAVWISWTCRVNQPQAVQSSKSSTIACDQASEKSILFPCTCDQPRTSQLELIFYCNIRRNDHVMTQEFFTFMWCLMW